jgi:acetylornithine/N-succinyldiaminopimelate aminotransferase
MNIVETGRRYLTQNYKQAPIVLERGQGCYIWDTEGRRYLDGIAGIAVSVLGHAHPVLVGAIAIQASRLIHASNLFFNEPNVRLAEALCQRTPWAQRCFFANSGAEANEAALKLARLTQVKRGRPERVEIIACHQSFHGRTMATVTLTGQPKYQEGLGPLLPGVKHIPYGDLEALAAAITPQTGGFIVEPIQGEGGVRPAPAGYLKAVRELCTAKGVLLMVDEVQTGTGRTGRFWAHEHDALSPDIVTLAKGLGGGVPIGVMLASADAAEGFQPGIHGSTFGGNPLACAAALATLETIDKEHLLEHATQVGAHLGRELEKLGSARSMCKGVRGRGMLWGLVVDLDSAQVVERARGNGLLVHGAGKDVVRVAPPLVLTRAEADELVSKLDATLATF